MQYHVAKNGQKTGPFSQEEVYTRLVSGELSGSDLGWHEGLADWLPLIELLPPPQAAGAPVVSGPVFATAPDFADGGPSSSKTSGLAIASLICGILSFFSVGITSVPAIITGHMALSRIKRSLGPLGGHGLAVAGLVTGYLGACLLLLMVLSLAVGLFNSNTDAAKMVRVKAEMSSIKTALTSYKIRSLIFPTTEQGLQALVEKPTAEPIPQNYQPLMKMVLKDSWGREYLYRCPAQKSTADYDLYSLGPDGIEDTEDDIGNW